MQPNKEHAADCACGSRYLCLDLIEVSVTFTSAAIQVPLLSYLDSLLPFALTIGFLVHHALTVSRPLSTHTIIATRTRSN